MAFGAYLRFIRPWQLRWGATEDEVIRAMPGDDMVTQPTFNATRAVTIQGRPEEIWPWLVQIGCTQAGMYSYDWLDNAGIHSAEQILPEFQHLAVGDFIPMTTDGKQGMWVKAFEWNKATLRVRPTRPCLEVVYAGPPMPPRRLLSEAVLLMTPLWRAIMWGNTAQVSKNGPVRLIAMVLFPSMPLNARTSKR